VFKLKSGWILPGIKAGLLAALLSGLFLYFVLLVFFRHLFTTSYDFMLAPILFVSHMSVILGTFGVLAGLFWRLVFGLRRRRAYREEAHALCVSACLAGAAAFFAGAWVAFGLFPGRNGRTVLALLCVAVVGRILVRALNAAFARRSIAKLMPSNRAALALVILSAFGTVLGKSVRSEYLTCRPNELVESEGNGGDSQPGGLRANLLLITIDTLRADHLGCYGYARNTSPSADSLAAEGVLFAKAYAQRPKTSPSFASILTGTYPQRHGVRRTRQVLPGAAYTLAEALRDAGYHTCAVVTNGNLFPAFGFDQGFGEYLYGHSGAREGTEIALERLGEGLREPFFLWVHHTDPHTRYQPPRPFDEMFAKEVLYGKRPLRVLRGGELGGVRRWVLIEGPLDLDYYISQYDGEIAYTDHWVGALLAGLRELELSDRTLVVFASGHGESLGEHDYYFEHGLFPYEPSARIPLIVSFPGVAARGARDSTVVESVDIMPTVLDLLGLEVPSTCQGESLVPAVPALTTPTQGRDGRGAGAGETRGGGSRRPSSARGDRPGPGARAGRQRGGERRQRAAGSGGETGRLAYVEAGYGHHTGPGYTFAVTDGRYKLVVRDIAWVVRPRNVKSFLYSLNALFEGGAAGHELYDLVADPGETRNLIGDLPGVASAMRERLDVLLDRLVEDGALPPDEKGQPLDEETVRSLRALGYLK